MNNNANPNHIKGVKDIDSNADVSPNIDHYHNKSGLLEAYVDTIASSIEFYSRLNSAFIDALSVPFKDAREEIKEIKREVMDDERNLLFLNYHQQQELYKKTEKIILSKIHDKFDTNFREKTFVISLSEFIESYCNLAKITGAGLLYQQVSNLNAYWNNTFVEPIRDIMYRTPSHKIHSENKYSLFHYDIPQDDREGRARDAEEIEKQRRISQHTNLTTRDEYTTVSVRTPLLIVYAFINRNYILDLLPNFSIVRNFQKQGFDVYATDWGTPSAFDKELTIGHYVDNYLVNAVDYILKHSNSEKVSLLGYCWGGDLALMYTSLYPEKIKNIVTFATPGDFSIDNNLLSVWTKGINADTIVDTFGNIPGEFINSSFLLRSPIDILHKYPHFFLEGGKPKDLESIMQFFATETWLYDSPPIIGEIYRQFVDDCYKKNLLIKNEMIIDGDKKIDLRKIKHPFLNVIAKKDDLVDPESSRAINNAIGSVDKSIIEFDSGHVGACISSRAHQQLWPKVGDWLKTR